MKLALADGAARTVERGREAFERLIQGSGHLRRWLMDPDCPTTAVEVRARAIGAVRLNRERNKWGLGAAASLDLPEGCLDLSMVKPNVADPETFTRTLKAVLERVGVLGVGRVALVLPDPVARIALLPGPELRGRSRRDTEEMIRFRLKKAVPFEIRDARVAYVPPPTPEGSVLVAAMHRPVLESFESACHAVGLEAGLVEVAGVALMSAVEATRPPADRLIVNWDVGYVSFIVTRAGWPVLIRTLTGPTAAEPETVAAEATQTLLYYRDRLGGTQLSAVLVRSALLPEADALGALLGPLDVPPEVLDVWQPLGVTERLPVAHALAGAAAAVGRKMA